jgi:hypothetical protein
MAKDLKDLEDFVTKVHKPKHKKTILRERNWGRK